MKFKNPFGTKKVETKSSCETMSRIIGPIGNGIEHQNVNSRQAIDFYNQVSVLYTAVDMLCKEVANIPVQVRNKKTKEFIDDSPILKLLESPNADIIGDEMAYNESALYAITSNVYWHVSSEGGMPGSEVLELSVVKPQNVSAVTDGSDFVLSYTVGNGRVSSTFNAVEDVSGIRYFDRIGNELWHVKAFNPNVSPYGQSRLTNLYFELSQFIEASKTNSAFFKNGAKPGGVLTPDPDISEDDKDYAKAAFKNSHTGSENSSKWIFAAGMKEVKPFNTTAKDMDFANLRKTLTQAIYLAYGIPLALVDADAIRFKNSDDSRLAMYDNGVFPLINRLLAEKTRFLMHRYLDTEIYELSYDPKTISALESRFLAQALAHKEIGVETINEVRAIMGVDESPEGDDLIIKLGVDDEPEEPPKDEGDESKERKQFMSETKRLTQMDEAYLAKIADDAGL